jgi:hypothetical protein
MDLWYDLAVRELADLDAHVAELIEDEKAKTSAKAEAEAKVEAEVGGVVAVDFF